jgi:hypothetical protein
MNSQWLTIEQIGEDVVLKECSRDAKGVIELPENITHIADYAFAELDVTIKKMPSGLKEIGKNAFGLCSFDEPLVNLPKSLEKIGGGAFGGTNIIGLYIPASVKNIGGSILPLSCKLVIVDDDNLVYDSINNCNAIIETATGILIEGCDNADIPYGVKEIAQDAFSWRVMRKVDLPDTLITIGESAFQNITCPNNTVIEIPSSVRKIGLAAFHIECENYGFKVKIDSEVDIQLGDNITYSLDEIETDNEEMLWAQKHLYDNGDGECYFTETEEIPSNCFKYSLHQNIVESVYIPAEVKCICEDAFEGCTNLKKVKIENPSIEIEDGAFNGCWSLISIVDGDDTPISRGTF